MLCVHVHTCGKDALRWWDNALQFQVYEYGRQVTWSRKGEEPEAAKIGLTNSIKTLEEEALGDKLYFGGEKFGYLDVVVIGLCSWLHTYEIICNFNAATECPSWWHGLRDAWKGIVSPSLFLNPRSSMKPFWDLRRFLDLTKCEEELRVVGTLSCDNKKEYAQICHCSTFFF